MIIQILRCEPKMIAPIVSWGIRLVENTSYSHYAILADGFVFDASGKGVRCASYEEFKTRYKIILVSFIDIKTDNMLDIFKWYKLYALQHYGYLQNFIILLRRLRLVETQFFKSGITCSELTMMFLRDFFDGTISEVDVGLIEVEEYFQFKGITNVSLIS